ncbi:17946_t:CDS:2 [Cetraspora pellucida]|uniref:17946_t:CDS:1 n=1 Tax=Cetraspora pellucida TaxID=1433469 RepID=A0A9N9G625_9GLOM|nr:17946_t:CDS:2 [Cetraspora pellucida]
MDPNFFGFAPDFLYLLINISIVDTDEVDDNYGPSQLFAPGNLIFISEKFIIENSEQCMSIAYATNISNENSNYEFEFTSIPICIPHCMFYILVNCTPKQTEGFIHFGSNIKVGNTYLVSGLFKFSNSGKMMIEATDIDYSKSFFLNSNISRISSSMSSNSRSIIDIIADDIDCLTDQSSKKSSSTEHDNNLTSNLSKTLPTLTIVDDKINLSLKDKNYINLNIENSDKEQNSNDEYNNIDKNNQDDSNQPKKRKRSLRIIKNKEKQILRK